MRPLHDVVSTEKNSPGRAGAVCFYALMRRGSPLHTRLHRKTNPPVHYHQREQLEARQPLVLADSSTDAQLWRRPSLPKSADLLLATTKLARHQEPKALVRPEDLLHRGLHLRLTLPVLHTRLS